MLLGKYRVESTLGFGGMGLVLKAHNVDLGQDVAIKILREDVQIGEDNIARFVREAKNAVKLKSEHVARIRDVGKFDDGRPYMVMELLEGLDLGKLLLDAGRIGTQRAVDLVLQACDAIGEAHSLGIVHRDIKPTNLFVAKRPDGTDIIKVLDFGISKAAQGNAEMVLTQTQSMLGTPAYMSPEQMRSARTVDPRSDIWSIGCVLYEAVEGHPPFEASNFAELCVMVATEDPAPLEQAPELGGVLMRCLAKNIEDRYQNIAELAADLAPMSSDPKSGAHQVGRIQRVLQNQRPDGTPPPVRPSQMSLQRLDGVPQTPLPQTPSSMVPAALANDTVYDLRKGSVWKTIAVLVVLFAIGIGAGLYVTRGGENTDSQAGAPDEDAQAETPAAAPIDAAAIEVDARDVTVERGSNAGSAGVGRGSAVRQVATPKPPPPKKPPPKKPPPPPKKQPPAQGSGAGSAVIVKPPVKKCDPFENKNGC
jgi:eukaryotic-like serine/threonine-protein kinase